MAGEVTASQVVGKVGADTAALKAGYADAKEQTTGLKGFFKSAMGDVASVAGGFLAAAGLQMGIGAIVGAFKDAIQGAGDFNASMTLLVTGANESASNLKMVSASVLQMAVDTGTTTQQLSAGLFMIESAGYHGAAALKILHDAAEGAKVGNADLGVVADATTTILTDFASTNITSAQAVNILLAAYGSGKVHLQDLAASLSQILPTAESAKVSLIDVMAAMATMTAHGVPAADAATYLRQMLIGLDAPGSLAVKTLKDIGLNSADVAKEMQTSLPGALQMITDALAKKFPVGSAAYVTALKDIAGGSKNLQGFLDLTGDNLKLFQQNVTDITAKAGGASSAINGWSTVQDDFNQKMDVAKQVVQTLLIQFGEKLLPIIGNLADAFSKNLVPTVGHLKDAIKETVVVVQNIVDWTIKWHDPIIAAGTAITVFFLPAIIKSGVEAVIAGGKIVVNFVAGIIKSGVEATIAAGKLWLAPQSFLAGLGKTGDAAKESAAAVTDLADAETLVGEKAVASEAITELATAEQAVGAEAAASGAVQELAVAEQAVGDKAAVSGNLQELATAEKAVGTEATTATGAAGSFGVLGLVAGLALLVVANANTLATITPLGGATESLNQQFTDMNNLVNDATNQWNLMNGQWTKNIPILTDVMNLLQQSANNTANWNAELQALDRYQFSNLPGAGFENPTAPGTGKRAAGGPVRGGMAYTVGESGQELFVPQQNGYIIPHQQTQQLLGGGGHTVNNHFYGAVMNGRDLIQYQQQQKRVNQALYGRG